MICHHKLKISPKVFLGTTIISRFWLQVDPQSTSTWDFYTYNMRWDEMRLIHAQVLVGVNFFKGREMVFMYCTNNKYLLRKGNYQNLKNKFAKIFNT